MPSVHAPIVDSLVGDGWGRAYSTATRDNALVAGHDGGDEAALDIARHIPFSRFVLHLGVPRAQNSEAQTTTAAMRRFAASKKSTGWRSRSA